MTDLSVIVPVYGVEAYVGRCAESLLGQTLAPERVEYIFVDDCSPDGSVPELRKVIGRHPERQCRILRHEVNRGLPAARNTGLAAATGTYVYHCDSDDRLEPQMLEKLLDAALAKDADIVWCDFFLEGSGSRRRMAARDYRTADDLLRRGYLAGDMKYNVWNKLVRRSLYDGVSFPEGHSMGEDMTMIPLAAKASKVAYVPEALYNYNVANAGAMSHSFSEAQIADIDFNTARVAASLGGDYAADLQLFKLNVKLPLLLTGRREDFDRWRGWFPEAYEAVWRNRELPLRTKLLQHMASKGCCQYVRMYSSLIKRIAR